MNVDQLMASIFGEESGGNYDATNSRTGAHGKYQIMPANWPEWAQEAGLAPDAPQTPTNQETVARFKMGEYLQKYGPEGAAVAWYAGEHNAQAYVKDPTNPHWSIKQGPAGKEPSIAEYVHATTGGGTSASVAPAPAGAFAAASTSSSSATSGDQITPQSTPAQVEAYIYKHYSDVAPFLANPEIKKILFESAQRNLSDSEVGHRLMQTTYYKTHSSASRGLDLLIGSDPASAVELINRTKTTISNLLTQEGVKVDDNLLNSTAKSALRSGLIDLNGNVTDTPGLQTLAVNLLKTQPATAGAPTGATSATADQLAAIARTYYVPMTPADLQKAALDIQAGASTVANFTHDMAVHSQSIFARDPDIVTKIASGGTPTDYFAPIKNIIANTLEMTPDQVDLMSPTYQGVLQMYDPKMPGGGGRRAMTMGEAQQWARTRPGYLETQQFKQTDTSFATNLLQEFGAVK